MLHLPKHVSVGAVVLTNVSAYTYSDRNDALDLLPLVVGVVAVAAHVLRLQNISCLSIQTEEGAVQLGVFVWERTSK